MEKKLGWILECSSIRGYWGFIGVYFNALFFEFILMNLYVLHKSQDESGTCVNDSIRP